MKTNNKKKMIVTSLSVAMAAALVGSISGTVAWYQYSTRASASMVSVAAGTSRDLQVSRTGADGSFSNFVSFDAGTLKPVKATLATGANLSASKIENVKFYDKPVYQYAKSGKEITLADMLSGGYAIQQTLFFRVMDSVDGADPAPVANKPVYLQDLSIKAVNNDADKLDLSNAVKVNFGQWKAESTVNATLGNTAKTVLAGRLDIGGEQGQLDTDGIRQDDAAGAPIFYGADVAVSDVVAQLHREGAVDGTALKLFRCAKVCRNVMGEHDFCFGVALRDGLFDKCETTFMFAVEVIGG